RRRDQVGAVLANADGAGGGVEGGAVGRREAEDAIEQGIHRTDRAPRPRPETGPSRPPGAVPQVPSSGGPARVAWPLRPWRFVTDGRQDRPSPGIHRPRPRRTRSTPPVLCVDRAP